MQLPQVDWSQTDYLILGFQDFVTISDGRCLELQKVEQHYGDWAHRVIVIHWPYALDRCYQGPINLVYFDVHEYEIMINLKTHKNKIEQIANNAKLVQWQCLNGRRCSHRLRTCQILEHWPNGTFSYGSAKPLADWSYDTYRGTSNEDNYLRLESIYRSHVFNIVTETIYDQTPGIISEKTFFALLGAQIPLVISYRGAVKDCQALGFDMFGDLLDLSYDDLDDDHRLEQALELNRDVILNYRPDAVMRQRLQKQSRWILDQWPQQALLELKHQIQAILRCPG